MSAKVLTHPTLAALATQVHEVVQYADGPATDVDIALALDEPIAAIRSALAALWLADLIAPEGSLAWTPVVPAPERFVEFDDEDDPEEQRRRRVSERRAAFEQRQGSEQ